MHAGDLTLPGDERFEALKRAFFARLRIGNAVVTRVVEWLGDLAAATQLFPHTPITAWQQHADLLTPAFWDPDTQRCRLAVQTWVVEVEGLTIVVDTGVGNDRHRPQLPAFHRLHTDYLESLEGAGFDRYSVDVVVNSHIHADHVGWNTTLRNGVWEPTFPNARYFVPAEDYRYFHPENAEAMRPAATPDEAARFAGMRVVFDDSILPVDDAGQLVTWSGEYQLSPSLRLAAAPGHTPGSSVLWLIGPPSMVFAGDLIHTPLQFLRPDDPCALDLDAAEAASSRRRVLAEAAQRNAIVVPAHYPGRGGASIHQYGNAFRVERWLECASI